MELDEALALANRLLDAPNADPDDSLRILSRHLLREHEKAGAVRGLEALVACANTIGVLEHVSDGETRMSLLAAATEYATRGTAEYYAAAPEPSGTISETTPPDFDAHEREAEQQAQHGGRPMTLRECMDAEDGGAAAERAAPQWQPIETIAAPTRSRTTVSSSCGTSPGISARPHA